MKTIPITHAPTVTYRKGKHPDYVRDKLKRWRRKLTRALNEVAKLEKALARAENKREHLAKL